jgi:hypothetical protein
MTWEQAGQLCFDQLPLVAQPLPAAYWGDRIEWRDRVRFLFAEHERWKERVDAAMSQFAWQRTWPELAIGSMNYLVCARLTCASDTVNSLLAADDRHRLVADPKVDSTTVLNWLLIETWHSWRWDSYLKLLVLRSLSGQDSFYGQPAPSPNN